MSDPCWGDFIMHFLACNVLPVALVLLLVICAFCLFVALKELYSK